MKAQHEVKFKRRRKSGKLKKTATKVIDDLNTKRDVVKATVFVGERQLQLARALSDAERQVRDSSLSSLREWLTKYSKHINEKEMDRLWKGLFYCVWMADKRPIVTETVNNVVNLADIVGWPFLEAMYTCLMREWFGIDRHRVDKFYELANVGTAKCVSLILASENLVTSTKAFLALLQRRVWSATAKRGLGMALHLLDIYMDSIMSPITAGMQSLLTGEKEELVEALLNDPMSMIGASSGHLLAVGKRIQERILIRLLHFLRREETCLESESQLKIAKGVSKRVFDVAAKRETFDKVRRQLYDIHTDLKAFVTTAEEEKGEG